LFKLALPEGNIEDDLLSRTTGDGMNLQPVTLKEARRFVDIHHRHHKAPQGGLFAIGLAGNEEIIGVAIVGRPIARMLDNGYTAEVTRLCVLNGYKNACSMLYSACWRAARAIGYKRLITYILSSESGQSLKAAGWKLVGECGGGTWNRKDRPRIDTHPLEQKKLFEVSELCYPKVPQGD
jgi:hypothetical protein